MILSEEQRAELLEVAKPLIEWLNNNCHPHCEVTVTPISAELVECVANVRTDEFVKD